MLIKTLKETQKPCFKFGCTVGQVKPLIFSFSFCILLACSSFVTFFFV